jgi:hypothetical protein
MRRLDFSPRRPFASLATIAGFSGLAVMLMAGSAHADDTVRRPGDHPKYHVEVEPHLSLGWAGIDGYYGDQVGLGFIPGVRIGIPIVENGFIPTINNSIAISFGFDAVYYGGCWNGAGNCDAWYLEFPATMQWNFYVAQHWSVFGEPGFFLYHGFFSNCYFNGSRNVCNGAPNGYQETGIYPAFYVGARYYFSDKVTLTMRVGYPTFTVGVSFLP